METNKVNVKIYGQEYVIAGDKPREEIIQVAAHVDMKMQEIGEAAKSLGASPSNIAVLSAVNIASEYFEVLEEIEELKRLNLQLEKMRSITCSCGMNPRKTIWIIRKRLRRS